MSRQNLLHFYPERIAWIGLILLGAGVFSSLPFLWEMQNAESSQIFLREKRENHSELVPYSFHLGLSRASLGISIPDLQDKMTFSFDPPRPDGTIDNSRVLVRMKESGDSKRVVLPCRLDLEFQKDLLKLASNSSLFWVELSSLGSGQIEVSGWVTALDGTKMDAGRFTIFGEDCPLQAANEFPEGSPFRILSEAKWWGLDLFRKSDAGERIEIGEILEISEGDWLIWNGGKWEKSEEAVANVPIARIQSKTAKMLVLEGWDSDGHTRIGLNLAAGPPFKIRGEDLFGSIRVRSEKQISCTIEKQCMVLKTGDWVLKTGSRWKILRKKDERDAFLNGQLFGELFILEQVFQKQGQKMIQGSLFNPGRTQVVSIEMAAQAGRKAGQKHGRRS